MRYPIFIFDGNDLAVYKTLEEHWVDLEVYDIAYPEVLLDSDGRPLTKSDAGSDRVRISETAVEPDPERLRGLLIHALRARGQEWSNDASLDDLIRAALATRYKHPRRAEGGLSRLLRLFHRR